MNEQKTDDSKPSLKLEYHIDEPPQKVWRAISLPEFRENWLPKEALAGVTIVTPGQEVRYKMRESAPPFLESVVTFQIAAHAIGGTNLRIIHELTDARFDRVTRATANNNSPPLMRAA